MILFFFFVSQLTSIPFCVLDQPHPKVIHWFALTGFIISLLAILKAAFFTARSPSLADDGERAPLIAGSD
jgi:hypothetical protein